MNSREKAKEWIYPRHKEFVTELRSAATEWFKANDFTVHSKMSYCLDTLDNWANNMVLPEVADYIEDFKSQCEKAGKPFPLHKYAHHGLSSQAMVFNLVGPLITRNDLSPLIELLKSKGVSGDFKKAQFEYEDRNVFNEDSGQPTSIDLVLFDAEGRPKVFIESKLVEAEFGGCSIFSKGDCSGKNPVADLDQCYLHFIGRKYWDLMKKYGFKEHLKTERVCVLVNYYQFFREILLSLDKGGYFVLLSDARSPVFDYSQGDKRKGLLPLLLEFVPDQYKDRIIAITVQELLASIALSEKHQDWISDFERKYGVERTRKV